LDLLRIVLAHYPKILPISNIINILSTAGNFARTRDVTGLTKEEQVNIMLCLRGYSNLVAAGVGWDEREMVIKKRILFCFFFVFLLIRVNF